MLTILSALLLSGPQADATEIGAEDRSIGLGLVVGTPSGVTGKYYFDERRQAVDVTLAARPFGAAAGGLGAEVTYLFAPGELARGSFASVPWHIGIGALAYTSGFETTRDAFVDGDVVVGARAPIGIDVDLQEWPLQFFADVALVIPVLPAPDAGIDIAAGARYYF